MGINQTLSNSKIDLDSQLSEKEKAAIYLGARVQALTNARLYGTKLTRKMERDIEQALKERCAHTPRLLSLLINTHDAYRACKSFDEQNVFIRKLVDKNFKAKAEAAIYFEAHIRALTHARRHKATNVKQLERRIEDVIKNDVIENKELLKAMIEQHNAYLACPNNDASNVFIKRLVNERVSKLEQSVEKNPNVNIIFMKTNPSNQESRR